MANYDYTKYNYQELIREIQRQLDAASHHSGVWSDSYHSSTAQTIIQIIAAMTDNLHYMLERRTQENFLPTAQLSTSVNAIANLLGYRPRLAVSSSGTLELELGVSAVGNINIPKYTKVSFGDQSFVAVDEITITAGQGVGTNAIPISVIEGTVESVTVNTNTGTITSNNSDKDVFYELDNNFLLIKDYSDIANDSFVIYSDSPQDFFDVTKTQPDGSPPLGAISFAGSEDEVFDIRLSNDGLRILFGDGTFGETPSGVLTVKWVKTGGPTEVVPTVGNSFSFPDYAQLEDDITPIPNTYTYTLTNTTTIDGALVAESTDKVKLHAPDFIKTGNRAVTKHDFSYWTKQSGIGGIIDANAYGEEETGINVYNANNVYVIYLQKDATALTVDEKQDLKDFLDVYKTVTTLVIIEQATNIPLQINVELTQNPNLSLASSQVSDIVRTALTEFFEIKEGSIGNKVYHSEIVEHLQNYTSVDQTGVIKPIARNLKVTIKALKQLTVSSLGDEIITTVPVPVLQQPTVSPPDNILKNSIELLDENGNAIASPGFQIVDFSQTIEGTDSTGLSGATTYNVDVSVDGGAAQTISAIGDDLTTYADVVSQVNTQLSGAELSFLNGGFVIRSLTTGSTSTIDIDESLHTNKLFSSLNNFNSIESAVSGLDTSVDTPIDSDTGYLGVGIINYKTGELNMVQHMADGDYFIRYSQNEDQNFETSEKQVLLFDKQVLTNLLSEVVINTV